MRISLSQQIACIKREIAIRKDVYGKRVADGKMRQGEADYENTCIAAVLETLQEIETRRHD